MLNLKYANPKEKLLNAPLDIQFDMIDFVNCYNKEIELRNDIIERFNYPSLWAAIDKLLEHNTNKTVALMKLNATGYTTDDAFIFAEYEKEND